MRYQLTRFLALLNNFSIAQSATATAVSSSGSSMKEQAKYANSLEARINRLDTAWNKFTLSVGNAVLTDSLIGGIESLNDLASGAAKVIDKIGVLGGVFGILGVATFALSTKFRTFSTALAFGTAGMSRMQLASAGLSAGMTRLGIASVGVKTAMRGLLLSTGVGVAFALLGFAVEKIIGAYSKAKQAQEEFDKSQQKGVDALTKNKTETEHLIDQYNGLTDAKKKAGENWSVKQEQQYLSIQQKLADMYPQLISYIDGAGNAHLKAREQIDLEVKSTNDLIDAKKLQAQIDAKKNIIGSMSKRDDIESEIKRIQNELKNPTKTVGYGEGQTVVKKSENDIKLLKSQLLLFQNQWSNAAQLVTSKVITIADSYTKLEIDPNISNSVKGFFSSLDTSKISSDQLEVFAMQIGEAQDALQKAYKSGDETGFDKARKDVINLALSMGATKQQAYAFALSFDGIKKAAEAGASAIFAGKDGMDGLDTSAGDLTGTMNGLSGAIDGTTGSIDKNANAASILFGVTSDQVSQAENAIAVIQMLSGMENLSAQQKVALANATGILAGMYPQLNGQISENIGWISSQVGMMSSLSDVSGANASTMIANQNSTTKATIDQINQRIAGYQKELSALSALTAGIESSYEERGMSGAKTAVYRNATKRIGEINLQLASAQASKVQTYYDSGIKSGQVKPYTGSPEAAADKAKKGSGSGSSTQNVDVQPLDKYKMKMDELNNSIKQSEFLTSKLDHTSALYRSELEKQSQTYEQMSAFTLGNVTSLEKRNTAINAQISAMGDANKLNNTQKTTLNDLTKELESNTSEVYQLKDAWRGYQDQLLSMQQTIRDSISEQITAEETDRVAILQANLDATSKAYDDQIAQLQDKLSMLDEIAATEDRIAKINQAQTDIDKAKSDTRYSYIDAQGKEILTYNKEQVSQLEKTRDDMLKQYQRDDLKKATQDEINRLTKQKDDTNKALQAQLDDFKKFWDKLASDAKAGTVSFDTIQQAWQNKSISSLVSHVNATGGQLNNIGQMYGSLGVIARNMDAKTQQINASLYTAKNTATSTINSMSDGVNSGLNNLSNDMNKFGGNYGNAIKGIAGAAGDALNGMSQTAQRSQAEIAATLDKLKQSYEQAMDRAQKLATVWHINPTDTGRDAALRKRLQDAGINIYHEGGVVGSPTTKEGEFANKLFGAKPNEQVAKLLRGEVVINPSLPNVKNNLQAMQSLIANGKQSVSSVDQSRTVNIQKMEVKSNNPMEFFNGLENSLRSV